MINTAQDLFREAKPEDLAFHARYSLQCGNFEQALAVCELARVRGVHEQSIRLTEGRAQLESGETALALCIADSILEKAPHEPPALYLKALILRQLGEFAASRSLLERVLEYVPDFPGALSNLSYLLMPGRSYIHVLTQLHEILRPKAYLEIGVGNGATMALASTALQAVGVDPSESPLEHALPSTASVYQLTSDDFFEHEKAAEVFPAGPVDLVFIDGKHWFEYALRDFINAERWASSESTIVLHDCLPVSSLPATRDRNTEFWVGDVWKTLEVLLEYRPDLDIRVVPTAPSGLVIIRRLDPASVVLPEHLQEILTRYSGREYPYEFGDFPEHYRIIENSEDALRDALKDF